MVAVAAGDAAPPVENDSIKGTASESTQEASLATDKVHTQLLRLHRMLDERGQSQVKSLEELQSCCDNVRRRAQQAKLQFQEQYDALTSRLADKVEEAQCRGDGAASPSSWRPPASGSLEASLASPHTRHAVLLHALEVVASIPWRVQQRSLMLRVFDAWATCLHVEETHTPYSDADFFDVEEGYGPEWDVLGLVAEHVKLQAEMDFWSKEALNLAEANACMSSFSPEDVLAPKSDSLKLESEASMPEEDSAVYCAELCEQSQPQAMAAAMPGEVLFQATLSMETQWHSESPNGSEADGVEATSALSMGSAMDEIQEEETIDEGDKVELLLKCTPTTAPDEFGRSLSSDSSSGKEEVNRDALQVDLAEVADESTPRASEFAAAQSSMSPSLNQCGLDFSDLENNMAEDPCSEVAFDGDSTAGPDEMLPVGEDASDCVVDDTVTCGTPKSILHDVGSEDELAFEELTSTSPEEALAEATAAVQVSIAQQDDDAADVDEVGNNFEQAEEVEEVVHDEATAVDGLLKSQEEQVQQENENSMNMEKHNMKRDNAPADAADEKDADRGYPSDAECDVELASLPSMPQHEQLYGGQLAGAASHGCLEVSIYTPSIRTTSLRSRSEEFLDCMDELSFFDADTGSQMEKANCSDEEPEEICHDNISLAVSSDTNSNHVHAQLETPKSDASRVRDITTRLSSVAASLCGGRLDTRSDQHSCQSSEQPPHDQHTLDDCMHDIVEIVEEAVTESCQAESARMLAETCASSSSPTQQPEEDKSNASMEKHGLEGGDGNDELQLEQYESEQVAVGSDQLDLDHPETERLGIAGIKSSNTSREHEGGSPPSSLRICRTTSRKCCARRRHSADCTEHIQGKQPQATPHHCEGVASEERVPTCTAAGARNISPDEVLDTSVVDLELGPDGARPSEQE